MEKSQRKKIFILDWLFFDNRLLHCTNFPDIAQRKIQVNIKQKDKILRNATPPPP